MLSPRIIPCLDVMDGRVVKGIHFQCPQHVSIPNNDGPYAIVSPILTR